jgi:cell division septal protein FtsQ
MKAFTKFLMILVLLVLGGAGVFLATWDIPAPTAPVSKTISDDRFPR